jgi:RNA polymerase sigma factor (TIGR02999 family)
VCTAGKGAEAACGPSPVPGFASNSGCRSGSLNLVRRPLTFTSIWAMGEATRILSAIEAGDPTAAEDLLPLVYAELRKLAALRLAQEKPGQTLQATALVHEAFLRLVDGEKVQQWSSRRHFFAAAAESMRRILVDNARRKRRPKLGGDRKRVEFDEACSFAEDRADELLSLHEALEKLEKESPEKAELVKLRYFAGLSHQEAALALGIARATADRYWAYARVFLYSAIEDAEQA